MTSTKRVNSVFIQWVLITASILVSGLCWYFSNGLSGESWYLLWIAPIPVLIISFKANGRITFIISFLAYLIGKLSWFSYLVTVASLVPAIIFTVVIPLFFALIMIITRKVVIKSTSWWAVFAFPVFFTTFEFLLIKFSPDGTAGSIAYSQSDFLPLIQIASVTGILGITFLVTFIPSAIAMGWYYRAEKNKLWKIAATAVVIVASALLFGFTRISNDAQAVSMKVGLIALDEKLHSVDHPDFQKENIVTENYAKQIADLAAKGARLIVLPERAININKENEGEIMNILSNAAKQNHVFIVTGYTNYKNDPERNSALVINDEGNPIVDYNKVHLVKGFEDQFTPGSKIGVFNINGIQAGTAICKDLDFPGYLRKYGESDINFLCIPAWDFVQDDWLHSRMAILRGIENGFPEVRTARLGRLTISDYYGRVTYEASSSNGNAGLVLGKVPLQKINTFYTRFGDWFGIVNVIAALVFVLLGRRKKATN